MAPIWKYPSGAENVKKKKLTRISVEKGYDPCITIYVTVQNVGDNNVDGVEWSILINQLTDFHIVIIIC